MTTPYRLGFCPQCETPMFGRDVNRRKYMDNRTYRQMDMSFLDGQRVRTAICSDCITHPDIPKIYAAITADGSEACNEKIKQSLIDKQTPVGFTQIRTLLGG